MLRWMMKGWSGPVLFALLAGEASAQAPAEPLLFWRLRTLGVDEETSGRIEQVLRREIGRVPGVRLLEENLTRRVIQEQPELARCVGEPDCLVKLGRGVGAGKVVTGVLGTLGDVFSLDLRLFDVGAGLEVRRVSQTWGGPESTTIEAMRQIAARLLKPDSYRGNLELKTSLDRVKVYIDGDLVGTTPLPEPLRLSPGRHALKLERAGFRDFQQFVDVVFDRTVAVDVVMEGSGVSGVVSSERAEDVFSLGLKAGVISNLHATVGPKVTLEAGWRLPVWGGRLALLLESGAWALWESRTAWSESQGWIEVDGRALVWPVELSLLLRLLPDYPFSPYVGVGGAFYLVWQTLAPQGLPEQSFRDGVFGFQGFCGLEQRLGPGVLLLEVRFQWARLGLDPEQGGMSGQLGGLGALVGYRFMM